MKARMSAALLAGAIAGLLAVVGFRDTGPGPAPGNYPQPIGYPPASAGR